MVVELITNRNQGILNKMIELLSVNVDEKVAVLGEIEDAVYNKLSKVIDDKTKLFLSAGRRYTTKLLFEDLLDRKSVFVCDNNLNDERNLSNLIIVKNENEVKILLCGFPLTENNIENSASISVYVCGDVSEIKGFDVVEQWFSEEKNGYVALTQEVLSTFSERKAFRNEKAATISDELDEDEIVKSFRNFEKILNERKKELEVREPERKQDVVISDIEIEINLD